MTPCPEAGKLQTLLAAAIEFESFNEHIATCSQCQTVLEQGTDTPSPGGAVLGRLASTLGTGDALEVPGYEVIAKLGEGGMGVVYQARHLRLDRVVALKMLKPGAFFDAEGLRRFRTEAEAVARLQHPNVVQVFEFGEHKSCPYLAMEYCAAGSLKAKQKGKPLPAREAAALVEAVARGLQAVHEQGVVHRDLKPANVLLTQEGTPKIADFGLARKGDEPGDTQSGAVMGTPEYMAPEQAAGKAKQVGPAADVYSLGATLYELLTGHPPFEAPTTTETLLLVLRADPVPPRRHQPRLPVDLDTICLKCLEREPARRYPSAGELADDLGRFLRNEPIKARPAGLLYRGRKFTQRNKALVASTAVVVLTLVTATVGIGASLVQTDIARWDKLVAERDQEILRLERKVEQARLTERERQEAESALRLAESALAGRRWPEAETSLASAGKRLPRGAPADLLLRFEEGSADLKFARALDDIRQQRLSTYEQPFPDDDYAAKLRQAFHARGLAVFEGDAAAMAKRIRTSPLNKILVDALDDWATVEAKPEIRGRLLQLARLADPDPSGWRDQARDLALFKDGPALTRLVQEAPADAPPFLAVLVAERHLALGGTRHLDLLHKVHARHPEDFWLNFYLGREKLRAIPPDQRRLPGPEARLQLAAAIGYLRAAVAARPDSAFANNDLGFALQAIGENKEAITAFRRAVKNKPDLALAHANLALALLLDSQFDEAHQACKRAIQLDGKLAVAHYARAGVLAHLRQDAEAEKACDLAITLNKGFAEAHLLRAVLLGSRHEFKQKELSLKEAIRLSPQLVGAHHLLGKQYLKDGRLREAKEHLQTAAKLTPGDAEILDRLREAEQRLEETEALKSGGGPSREN